MNLRFLFQNHNIITMLPWASECGKIPADYLKLSEVLGVLMSFPMGQGY